MHLQVLLEVRPRRKRLLALLALERLVTRVDALVPDQVRDLAEGALAPLKLAFEGFQFVVDSQVLLQGRELSKCLVAVIAEGSGTERVLTT